MLTFITVCVYAHNVGGWIRKSILSKGDHAAIDPSAFQISSGIPLKSGLRIQMTYYLQKIFNCSCLQKRIPLAQVITLLETP